MVLPEDLLVVVLLLVDLLLLRIYIFLVRAFFRLVVLSTRMVCASFLLFRLCLEDLVDRVRLPGIMPHHRHLRGQLLG